MPKVMTWLAAIAPADAVLVKLVPPHARNAAEPVTPMPDPRVSPKIVRLAAFVDGAKGETPKFVWPLTSQPASVPVMPPLLAGLIVVASLAVLLAVLVSPPPETITELVMAIGALDAILTVMVMGGKASPAASTSERVQVSVPRFALQPVPPNAVAVMLAGRGSVTVMVPLDGAVPTLVAMIV